MPQNMISAGFRDTDLTWPSPLENVCSPVTRLQDFCHWTARSSRWTVITALFHQSQFSQLPMLFVFHIHFSNISVPCSHSSFFSNIAVLLHYSNSSRSNVISLTLVTTIQQGTTTLSVMLLCPLASFKYIGGKFDNSVSVSVWGINI
jgi:hypothetical protein